MMTGEFFAYAMFSGIIVLLLVLGIVLASKAKKTKKTTTSNDQQETQAIQNDEGVKESPGEGWVKICTKSIPPQCYYHKPGEQPIKAWQPCKTAKCYRELAVQSVKSDDLSRAE